ncbi:hypothetical protein [Paraburkholderia sp. J12]|uniref:hypothetical protein n=1 Tax=Paraburkholderia sp. J12 TaxID=2805432 RepID=UPI002ABDA942|nr:hypothetical protein [Paraburkholderia sp. J12]
MADREFTAGADWCHIGNEAIFVHGYRPILLSARQRTLALNRDVFSIVGDYTRFHVIDETLAGPAERFADFQSLSAFSLLLRPLCPRAPTRIEELP